MPVLLAPGILSLVTAAGMAVATGAGLRVEARAQETRPPVGENVASQGYEVEPVVGLEAWSPTLDLALAYGPRFTHLGGDGPDSDTWLQRAWAVAQWRPTEAWQLRANATATHGVVDLFRVATAPGQPGQPPPVGQAAPIATFLDYRRYELLFGADGRLGQQFDLRSALVLLREGGADAVERETLPLQQAALLRGVLVWRLSPRTSLEWLLSASETHYFDVAVPAAEPGAPTQQSWSIRTGRAEAAWRHALTSRTRTWAAAGLALVDSGAPVAGATGWQPFGEVGLGTDGGAGWTRFTGGVMAAGAPVEDRLTGTAAQRAEGRAWGTWTPSERWTLGASILGARVMTGPNERQAFTAGEFWVTWALRDVLLLTAGGRWTTTWPVQVAGSPGLPESQGTAYLSFRGVYRSGDAPVARPGGIPGMGLR